MNLKTLLRDAALVLLAGGSSARFQKEGAPITNKLFLSIAGRPVLAHSLDPFLRSGLFRRVVIVAANPEQLDWIRLNILSLFHESQLDGIKWEWVLGGTERASSVHHAIQFLREDAPHSVMIHDGARPAIALESIQKLAASFQKYPNAILAERVTDALKKQTERQSIAETVNREGLWRAQTPQLFTFRHLIEAYEGGFSGATDEAQLLENTPYPVGLVENPYPNPKLTVQADLPYIEWLLSQRSSLDR